MIRRNIQHVFVSGLGVTLYYSHAARYYGKELPSLSQTYFRAGHEAMPRIIFLLLPLSIHIQHHWLANHSVVRVSIQAEYFRQGSYTQQSEDRSRLG